MIVLDTHIWLWWVDGSEKLPPKYHELIRKEEINGLGLSTISVWEVAKLYEKGRIGFDKPIQEWMNTAISYPGIQLINITPEIAIASTQLPGNFHKDPADQIIVATARILNAPLLTEDSKIKNYPHLKLL